VRRKTIYEYHRVNLKSENITSHTAIRFLALDTCNRQKNCSACLAVRENTFSFIPPKVKGPRAVCFFPLKSKARFLVVSVTV
jgi:hypothetical protein